MSTSLISPNSSFILISILAFIAWFGVTGDRKNWFKKISGILVSMTLSGILVSIKILPSAADSSIQVPVYNVISNYFVLLAIPLLLFDVNLKRIKRESGRMLGIFIIGAIGVIIGAVVAGLVVPLGHEDSWKLSGIFTGSYIGGSMNFMALSMMYDFTANPLFPAAVAADNILTNIYLFILMLLPGIQWFMKIFIPWKEPLEIDLLKEKPIIELQSNISYTEKLLLSLAVSAGIVALGIYLGGVFQTFSHSDIRLDILVITLLTVLLVNIFPSLLKPLQDISFDTGLFLLYMFLAVVGSNCDFSKLFMYSPYVFLMISLIMFIHLLIILIFGKLFNYSFYEIGLASVANISGPSVCVPLAASYKTKSLVTPVILVAILGYALGNIAGFFVGWLLR